MIFMNLKGLFCRKIGCKLGWCKKCSNAVMCNKSGELYKGVASTEDLNLIKNKVSNVKLIENEVIDIDILEEEKKQKPQFEEL